jgi:hypothetical protein
MRGTLDGLMLVCAVFGISMRVDGDDIVLEAWSDPPAAVVAVLREHKAMLLEFLRGEGGFWG